MRNLAERGSSRGNPQGLGRLSEAIHVVSVSADVRVAFKATCLLQSWGSSKPCVSGVGLADESATIMVECGPIDGG